MQGDPNKYTPDDDELKYSPDDDELKYGQNGQSIYYSGLPSIGSIPGHSIQQSLPSHMQFSNNSISSTSSNGLVTGSLHPMHALNGNGLINVVVHTGASPDHQINSNSPNSTKKKRKSCIKSI